MPRRFWSRKIEGASGAPGRAADHRPLGPDPARALPSPGGLGALLLGAAAALLGGGAHGRGLLAAPPRRATASVGQPSPSWNRSILTEIYLCRACSYHEIEDGNGAPGGGAGAGGACPVDSAAGEETPAAKAAHDCCLALGDLARYHEKRAADEPGGVRAWRSLCWLVGWSRV